MEILSSRFLIRPSSWERSYRFYREILRLKIYREWGSGVDRGVVFFLGGGYLELSGHQDIQASDCTQLWLQVPEIALLHQMLEESEIPILESPVKKPWGLSEMRVRDPDGLLIVIVEVPSDHPLRHAG